MLGAMKWALLSKSTDLEMGMKHSLYWNDGRWHCAASLMYSPLHSLVQQKFDMCLPFSIAACDTLVLSGDCSSYSGILSETHFLCIFLNFKRKRVLFQSLFCVVGTYLNCEKQPLVLSWPWACMEQRGSHWTYFHKIWFWNIFQNMVGKFKFD
jgi:hypothetical protein